MHRCPLPTRAAPAAAARSEFKGRRQRVLPRDFQVHPFRPKAICINWLRYRPGAYPGALIDIPLKAINEERCPAIKEGGWLLELTSKVRAPVRRARVVGGGWWECVSLSRCTRPPRASDKA